MVVKKLGEELTQEYLDVLEFLGAQQGLKVIVCQRACWGLAHTMSAIACGHLAASQP